MRKTTKILLVLIVGIFAASAIFLWSWDIPAPQQKVEKTLPDDRFPR